MFGKGKQKLSQDGEIRHRLIEIWEEEQNAAAQATGKWAGENIDVRLGATIGMRRIMERLLEGEMTWLQERK